jgi:glycosyltransferase involved in cell wall biosynthesis
MIKVLHFFKTSLPDTMGGIEQFIDQLCKGSKLYGIDSSVFSLSKSSPSFEEIKFNGYSLHRVKRNFEFASTDFALSAFITFSRLAKEADIIHYHFPWPFMDLVHFTTRINKPTIVTYHSDIVRQKNLFLLYQPLMNAFLRSVDEIIVTSPNYLESSKVLNNYRDKTSIIPIGLNIDSYPSINLERVEFWKMKFGPRFFLFVGVLRYYKGLHVLLEANSNVDIPVLIAGDGPLKESLQAESFRLGLKNTYFLGAISEEDKVALLSICYGVVFPSHLRSEAFGISLLEGAMFGKAMISCEIGTGTSFINLHNVTGLVIPPNDSKLLRKAMLTLWNDRELTANMGNNAKIRFENKFTFSNMINKYSIIYHRLFNKN